MDERYSRQILLEQIQPEGQAKFSNAKVAIVGIGALGTVAAELLVRAGIQNLLLIDRDIIEISNLQRQTLFTQDDINKPKATTAKHHLLKIDPSINITTKTIHLNSKNIHYLNDQDLILDCTDNLATRFLIDEFCHNSSTPWIYAAAIKTSGYVMPILPQGPCLHDFLQETPLPTCDTVGVLNTITTTIAALQTTIAIKILLNKPVQPQLYHIDIWKPEIKTLQIKHNPDAHTTNYLNHNQNDCIRFCATGKFQIIGKPINLQEKKEQWEKIDTVIDDTTTLQFKNIILFPDGRALIQAATEAEARTTYSKYIGN